MADGAGNGISRELAQEVSPFEIRISYHPITHQVSFQFPQCDDIIRLGMISFAAQALADMRAQSKPIISPLSFPARGPRLT